MLYQQGVQKIEVIVKKEGGGGAVKEKEAGEVTTNQKNENIDVNKKLNKRFWKINATHAIATAKQVGGLIIEYNVGRAGMLNGDMALQQKISRNMEIIKDAGNIISSIGIGATYGSMGGIPGMIVGASLSAISSGVSMGVKYARRQDEFNFKEFKENNAIEYKRARAGINLTNGRLR